MSKQEQIQNDLENEFDNKLTGRKIKSVRYLTEEEQEGLGWYRRSLVIELDDGTLLFSSKDDEGNDAGALFGQSPNGNAFTIPVI